MSSPPELITRYLDFGTSVAKESTDMPAFGPIPPGGVEITYEQYLIRLAEIRGEAAEMKAAFVASDQQTQDDRIADIVAVKVAEALAARDAGALS